MSESIQRPLIDASVRYQATRQEISERIAIRAQINCYHITIITAISAAFIAASGLNAASSLITTPLMPIISTIFVLHYLHNEKVIGLLTAYASYLEDLDYKTTNNKMPRWFSINNKFNNNLTASIQQMSLKTRSFSDISLIILIFFGPSISIINFIVTKPDTASLVGRSILIFLSVSVCWCSFLSAYVLGSKSRRRDALDIKYDEETEAWIKPLGSYRS